MVAIAVIVILYPSPQGPFLSSPFFLMTKLRQMCHAEWGPKPLESQLSFYSILHSHLIYLAFVFFSSFTLSQARSSLSWVCSLLCHASSAGSEAGYHFFLSPSMVPNCGMRIRVWCLGFLLASDWLCAFGHITWPLWALIYSFSN